MITTKAGKTSMSQTENVSTLPPGYVTPYQWTHCWNAGWTLGSVTRNNHSAGSLPSNRVTAQRKRGYCLSVMALCLLENDNTAPKAYGISFKPRAAKGKKADEMAPATPLWQRTCVFKMKKKCVRVLCPNAPLVSKGLSEHDGSLFPWRMARTCVMCNTRAWYLGMDVCTAIFW